jgi:hypothetical protein
MQIIELLEEHYEVQEVPFGRSYKWCPEYLVVECDCGESTLFKTSSLLGSTVVCECGADHTAGIRDELPSHQPEAQGQMLEAYERSHHPWLFDTRAQTEQHLQDEAAHPGDSSWRYNDITSRGTDDERDVQ